MKWKTIKSIYISVFKEGCKFIYRWENRYTLIWFNDDGTKMFETDFDDGIMDGEDIMYDTDGGFASHTIMKKGKILYDLL